MAGRVQDKVALVTGAGSVGPGWGNGKASAVLMAREGARIFAVDINPDAAEETRRIIGEEGGACRSHVADVTTAGAVEAMVDACMGAFGRIDILHNNVGGSAPGGPVEMPEEVWDRQISHNLKHVYLVTRQVLPIMEKQGKGTIVNMSSVAALSYTGAHHIAYDATKAAIIRFSQAVAMQYAAKGIRCNTVIPGQMHSRWWKRGWPATAPAAMSSASSASATSASPWAIWATAGTSPMRCCISHRTKRST